MKRILFILIFLPVMFLAQGTGYYLKNNEVSQSFKERYFSKGEQDFFPMHVGDMWQYMYYDMSDSTLKYINTKIVSDTLVGNKRFFKYITIFPWKGMTNNYYRVGDISNTEYILDVNDFNDNGTLGEELLVDSLEAEIGTQYISYYNPYSNEVHVLNDTMWYVIDNDTLLVKEIFSMSKAIHYVDKFWIVEILPEQAPPILLTGAIIDGVTYGTLVGVEDESNGTIPAKFRLSQNYPNPFNPTTKICYVLPKTMKVKLAVYNSLGQELKVLVDAMQEKGEYEITYNATNLASGIYYYRLVTSNKILTRKMMLLK